MILFMFNVFLDRLMLLFIFLLGDEKVKRSGSELCNSVSSKRNVNLITVDELSHMVRANLVLHY